MRRFQFCEYKRIIVAGAVHIHARLKALRGEEWPIVGVFQLREEEWQALVELCNERGIPVTHDVEEPAVHA